jgi:hypothetical protein
MYGVIHGIAQALLLGSSLWIDGHALERTGARSMATFVVPGVRRGTDRPHHDMLYAILSQAASKVIHR